jgi:hypothetical protein
MQFPRQHAASMLPIANKTPPRHVKSLRSHSPSPWLCYAKPIPTTPSHSRGPNNLGISPAADLRAVRPPQMQQLHTRKRLNDCVTKVLSISPAKCRPSCVTTHHLAQPCVPSEAGSLKGGRVLDAASDTLCKTNQKKALSGSSISTPS